MFANYIIGQTLFRVGRFREAVPFFTSAAEIASAVYPSGHRYTGDSWQYVGRARLLADDAPGAVEALRVASAEYDRVDGLSDEHRALLHYWRGRAYVRVGSWSEAIRHLREAQALWAGSSGARPPEADSVAAVLAVAYDAIGRPPLTGR
jgi:tetratricopeptide (TPR) repeat protein